MEVFRHRRQGHPVLRPAGPGNTRLDGRQVELHDLVEHRLWPGGETEQPLRPRIRLDQLHVRLGPARQAQVRQRLSIDGKQRRRGAVLGRHVGDGGPVGQRQRIQAGPEELHELSHDADLAQYLRHGQHEIGGGDPLRQFAGQTKPNDLWGREVHRLAQQHRLRLNAAHAPPQHSQTVDHGRVGIGADERIGAGDVRAVDLLHRHHLCQVLQVDLVHDPRPRRDHTQAIERPLSPAQQEISLPVALVFKLDVAREGAGHAEDVHLHRVIDHQIGGHNGIHPA